MKNNGTARRFAATDATGKTRRAWALILAAALCLGLMPSPAWAVEETDDETFSVALTVIDSTDPASGVVKNVKVDGMSSGKTVADLLAAAGFKAGTQEEAEADATGMTYFESYNAPYFLGKGYDAGTGSFWASIFDGGSDPDGWKKVVLDAALTANGHYQYVYGTETAFSYSNAVPQLVLNAVNNPLPTNGVPDEPTVPEEPETPTYDADAFDRAAFESLFRSIAASYEGTASEWEALELAAIGQAASVDVPALLANAKKEAGNPGITNLQRFILALTAVKEPSEAEKLVEVMASSEMPTNGVNATAFALTAYESGPYAVPDGALKTKDQLVADMLASQLSDGGWAVRGDAADADVTSIVLTALASHASQSSEVKTAIDKGLAALRGIQHEDGGFGGTGIGVDPSTNVNSTSYAVIALCALGIDPATSWATQSGATPMTALLSQATSDLSGFVYLGKANELATEQGYRALVAYQGLQNTGAAYNIYTQAKDGQAGLSAAHGKEEGESASDSTIPASSDKQALAKTADETAPLAAGAMTAALCALAAGVFAARRLRTDHSLLTHR